jgi:hypothetical protein
MAERTAEIFDKNISIIEIQNWTYMWQRSIIAPVSTILLQDNSLKPALKRAFFLRGSVVTALVLILFRGFRAVARPLREVMMPSHLILILGSSATHATDMRGGGPGVLRHTAPDSSVRTADSRPRFLVGSGFRQDPVLGKISFRRDQF